MDEMETGGVTGNGGLDMEETQKIFSDKGGKGGWRSASMDLKVK